MNSREVAIYAVGSLCVFYIVMTLLEYETGSDWWRIVVCLLCVAMMIIALFQIRASEKDEPNTEKSK